MVGLDRLELSTSPLSGVRSNHLSYRPMQSALAGKHAPRPSLASTTVRRRSCAAPAERSPKANARERNQNHSRRKRNEGGRTSACMHGARTDYPCTFVLQKNRKRAAVNGILLGFFLRKEVIQPQVPLRLPCYDFTPVADPTVVSCLLAVSTLPSGKANSHGVTGGVYKARERIHRGMLIRDY